MMISRVARVAALGEPGIQNTTFFPMIPAVARDSTTRVPTSATLFALNISPNPSRVFSKRGATASIVPVVTRDTGSSGKDNTVAGLKSLDE